MALQDWTVCLASATNIPSQAIAYGNGRWVALGWENSTSYYSNDDGVTWVAQAASIPSGDWCSIAWNGLMFVAVASWSAGSYGVYSYDGITWSTITMPTTGLWTNVMWSGEKWMAFKAPAPIGVAYSYDGKYWYTQSSTFYNYYHCTIPYKGFLLTVGSKSGDGLYISTDHASSWQTFGNYFPAPGSGSFIPSGMAWDGNSTIVVSTNDVSGNNNTCLVSKDMGVSWQYVAIGHYGFWEKVFWTGAEFIILDRDNAWSFILRSPDGLTWNDNTVTTQTGSNHWAAFGGLRNNTLMFGLQSKVMMSKQLGMLPTKESIGKKILVSLPKAPTNVTVRGFAAVWGGDKYVVVNQDSQFYYSYDGINWVYNDVGLAYGNWRILGWNGQNFLAVEDSGTAVAISSDGITWAYYGTAVASGSGRTLIWTGSLWLLFSSGSAPGKYSSDGITWTPLATNPSGYMYGKTVVKSGSRLWCISGAVYNLVYSDDNGNNWTDLGTHTIPYPPGGSWNWTGLAMDNNGRFVAVSSQGTSCRYVVTSPDGINWTVTDIGQYQVFSTLKWTGREFVLSADYHCGSAFFSKDGLNWEARPLPWDSHWNGVCVGGPKKDQLLLTSNGGCILYEYPPVVSIPVPGRLYMWGKASLENCGITGDGTTNTNYSTPSMRSSSPVYSDIACGASHGVAIRNDGTAWAWGSGSNGQVGAGVGTYALSPTQIGTRTDWGKCFASENSTTFLVTKSGELWYVGLGTGGDANFNVSVATLTKCNVSGTPVKVVSSGSGAFADTYVLMDTGALWVTGRNASYELGFGDATARSDQFYQLSGTFRDIAARGSVFFAVKSDGGLWTVGYSSDSNVFGLGGGSSSYTALTQVGVYKVWSKVDTNGHATWAIREDGTLWSWGNDYYGDVGNSGTSRTTPGQVGTASNWVDIYVAAMAVIAVNSLGEVWVCGYETNMACGLGSTGNITTLQKQTGSDCSKARMMVNGGVYIRKDGVPTCQTSLLGVL